MNSANKKLDRMDFLDEIEEAIEIGKISVSDLARLVKILHKRNIISDIDVSFFIVELVCDGKNKNSEY